MHYKFIGPNINSYRRLVRDDGSLTFFVNGLVDTPTVDVSLSFIISINVWAQEDWIDMIFHWNVSSTKQVDSSDPFKSYISENIDPLIQTHPISTTGYVHLGVLVHVTTKESNRKKFAIDLNLNMLSVFIVHYSRYIVQYHAILPYTNQHAYNYISVPGIITNLTVEYNPAIRERLCLYEFYAFTILVIYSESSLVESCKFR